MLLGVVLPQNDDSLRTFFPYDSKERYKTLLFLLIKIITSFLYVLLLNINVYVRAQHCI